MADDPAPQTYLITPAEFELSAFSQSLARVLDARPVACVRLALVSRDEDRLTRAADTLREIASARDVALVIADHVGLAERLGLDGVHLDGARGVRAARKTLGSDAIVGAYANASRHDGLTAGEAGADYVSFGPLTGSSLGDGQIVGYETFEWWSEMIEIPVVAEGGLDRACVSKLWNSVDFLAFGEEIWAADDPVAALDACCGR